MNRISLPLLTTILLAAPVPATAAAGHTLKLRAHDSGGSQHGDRISFRQRLTNRTGKRSVGHDLVTCTGAKGSVLTCRGTLTLAGGKITVRGRITHAASNSIAVTGGTGAYAGARGAMKITTVSGSVSDLTVTLR